LLDNKEWLDMLRQEFKRLSEEAQDFGIKESEEHN